MFLLPRKLLYKKLFRKHLNNTLLKPCASYQICYGTYGFKVSENCWLASWHLELIRRLIVKIAMKKVRIWFRLHLNSPITKKPANLRMGKGKGPVVLWMAPVIKGSIFIEFTGVSKKQALIIYNRLLMALPVKIILVLNFYRL